MTVLISVEDVRALQLEGTRVHVLDVRWRLDRPDGRPDVAAGHIPGAVFVDLESQLAGLGEPTDGRHPLPTREDLEEAARAWGLDEGDPVVVYDDLGGMSAARAWWLLRHHGVRNVRILDGAFRAWKDAGLPIEEGLVDPPRGSITLTEGGSRVVDVDEVASVPADGVLVDARAAERYAGDVEPVDPRAGHIPGAVSAPTAGNLAPDGRFLPPDVLRERFRAAGVVADRDVAVYCGSGVTAAHTIAALAVVGIDAALFPGSWSAWSNHPDRPVATGPTP
ncbi:sulfurtransferase [Labedella populi]|uniref:Sulfurtransferase n=1 Tax=Labedella populi TaxID=2498850 RepID=A0A444QD48_9MICO|nr:sulfurtransferase [Labedella populi]RWZ64609.1 sulfurtransferase [Labedella populi]